MILFKSEIRAAVLSGRISIHDDHGNQFPGWEFPNDTTGFVKMNPEGLQPASVDLHLGSHWLTPEPNSNVSLWPDPPIPALDTAKPIKYRAEFSDTFILPANGFVLVRTQEVIGLDESIFGKVDGRSSFGRAGLFAETAGVIDNGFYGSITLEIVNALPYPVKLYAGTRCCQITFYTGIGSAEGGYQGSYQGQMGTKGSMLYKTVPQA